VVLWTRQRCLVFIRLTDEIYSVRPATIRLVPVAKFHGQGRHPIG
jgi:hypothetical protein